MTDSWPPQQHPTVKQPSKEMFSEQWGSWWQPLCPGDKDPSLQLARSGGKISDHDLMGEAQEASCWEALHMESQCWPFMSSETLCALGTGELPLCKGRWKCQLKYYNQDIFQQNSINTPFLLHWNLWSMVPSRLWYAVQRHMKAMGSTFRTTK